MEFGSISLIVLVGIAVFVAFIGFKKPLLETTVEVLCQNTGKTFRIPTRTAQRSVTCRSCGRETFVVHLGEGEGNVSVTYIDGAGATRQLSKVVPGEKGKGVKVALATVSADSGTFILVEQKKG